MVAHFGLYPRHVGGVDEAVPVQQQILLLRVVAEHRLPAAGQKNLLFLAVEIPDSVIRRRRNQRVALVQFVEHPLVMHPLESRG